MELSMFVIYERPSDLPRGYAVQRWEVTRAGGMPRELLGANLPDLEAARELVPRGLYNLGRDLQDDPKIVEVWI